MPWSYSDPSSSPKDAVRFYLGDTIESAPLLTDEEIEFLLADTPNPLAAAAQAAESLVAAYSRYMDRSVGPLHISYSQRVKNFRDLADDLWDRAGGRGMAVKLLNVYVGGISQSEKDSRALDTDLVPPRFTRDLFQPVDMPAPKAPGDDS